MGRSLAPVLEAAPIEDYEGAEIAPPGPRRYRAERTAEWVLHHEKLLDDDGTVLYDQSVEVAYALGSGKRGRAYLIEHDGMLFKSSLAWFSKKNAWGLAPDYSPDSHKRFERRITDGCINCHAGRVRTTAAADTFARPILAEAAIGCERCHGPGREHVAAHEAAPSEPLPREFIVNPARLDSARQNAVCAECHLHGEATVVRTGRKIYDFRPGELLEDNRIVFVRPPAGDDESGMLALSQVEQMLASACYRGSGGRLSCTSCHDPHAMPDPQTRVEFYRAKCLACHDTRGCALDVDTRRAREPDDSCMTCHMPPALKLANVLHVSFADHRVPRARFDRSASGDARPPESRRLEMFDHADLRLPRLEVDRAVGFMLAGGTAHDAPTTADAREAERLLLAVRAAQPDDLATLESLGAACLIQGHDRDAQRWFQMVLKHDPRRESTLLQLAIYYHDQRQLRPAREYLERYLAINRWHGAIYGRYASTLAALGQWRECITAGERGLELNPTLIPLHEWLAPAYEQVGQPADADRHRRLADRLRHRLQTPQSPD
jgi:predicted CXXCH cytochrome family protein